MADPYVKGKLGLYKFRTKIQRKTLAPKWHEEFKIPVFSWDKLNNMIIAVHDKDHLYDDFLGFVLHDPDTFRDFENSGYTLF